MLKSKFYRILKSKKSIFFIVLLILIPIIDLLFNLNGITDISKDYILHPSMASFLSGNSSGHITQIIYVWMLPLYLLTIYCDSNIQENKYGYNVILLSRIDRKKLLKTRIQIAFIIPFVISFASLFINFILANIIFRGGLYFNGLERFKTNGINLLQISIQHPFLTYIIYIFLFCLITGGCGIICLGISILFPKYKLAYPIAFFIWIIQIAMPLSLTYAMQPFIEYGLNYIIPALIIFSFVVFIVSISSINYRVKSDKI